MVLSGKTKTLIMSKQFYMTFQYGDPDDPLKATLVRKGLFTWVLTLREPGHIGTETHYFTKRSAAARMYDFLHGYNVVP